MFEIMSDAGRPAVPAYIAIRRRYGPHRAGLIRRAIMARHQHVIGYLDPRKKLDEKLNLQAIITDERKGDHVKGNERLYRGSQMEKDMRGGKG